MRRHMGLLVLALLVGLVVGVGSGALVGYALGVRHASVPARSSAISARVAGPEADAVVAQVNPAVVTVENHQTVSAHGSTSQQIAGAGSGFSLDDRGDIVTNQHVIEGAESLTVVFSDGRRVPATLVGGDHYQDIAVVRVSSPVPAVAHFGDSSQLQAGQTVIAIGSALGEFPNTVTEGLVSGHDRSLDTGEGYRLEHLVQHDAPLSPGNSGGPLVDLSGNVVGMNTALVTDGWGSAASGLGFAIESNTVREFAEQLIATGRIDRPYLGLSVKVAGQVRAAPNDQNDTEPVPVVVESVDGGSPAEAAGIGTGEQITAVDGTALDDQHQFFNLLFAHKPGDSVTLTLAEQGHERPVPVTLSDRSSS